MKIAKVSAWTLQVPVQYLLLEGERAGLVNFVEIVTDDGIKGYGFSGYKEAFPIREIINREFAPIITGMDARNIEAVQERIRWSAAKLYNGPNIWAASLVDIALWDIKGKATGWPIWQLLGGARQTVPAYITFGLAQYSTEQLIEAAQILISQGHTSLKMVVGDPSQRSDMLSERTTDDVIDHDVRRVRALREAVGDDVEIMMDANNHLTYPQALRLAKLVEPYNLTWFEDPVAIGDPRLMAELHRQTTTPIAAGSVGTMDLNLLRELVVHGAVDYLQPNVIDIGGFTAGLKGAALAQAFNVPISMGGNWPHTNMHLHGGVPHGGRVEFHWQGWKCGVTLFDGAPEPSNNTVTLPDSPGLGFTPKDGIVEEYAIDS